jgi:hypothetical protein
MVSTAALLSIPKSSPESPRKTAKQIAYVDNLEPLQRRNSGRSSAAGEEGRKCTFAQGDSGQFALGRGVAGPGRLELFRGDGFEESRHFGGHVHRGVVQQPLHLQPVHQCDELAGGRDGDHSGAQPALPVHFRERLAE